MIHALTPKPPGKNQEAAGGDGLSGPQDQIPYWAILFSQKRERQRG